jgi:hypothetical protein
VTKIPERTTKGRKDLFFSSQFQRIQSVLSIRARLGIAAHILATRKQREEDRKEPGTRKFQRSSLMTYFFLLALFLKFLEPPKIAPSSADVNFNTGACREHFIFKP